MRTHRSSYRPQATFTSYPDRMAMYQSQSTLPRFLPCKEDYAYLFHVGFFFSSFKIRGIDEIKWLLPL